MISAKIENIENEIFEIKFDSKSNDSMNFENVDAINDNLMSFQKSIESINQKSIDSRRSRRAKLNIKSYARIQSSWNSRFDETNVKNSKNEQRIREFAIKIRKIQIHSIEIEY